MEDLTGRQFGPYQIVAPLGEGGIASVYKAYQPSVERYVALKVLPRFFANAPGFLSSFMREAKLLDQLQHPHILPVFDFGHVDDYTYIVMPFVQSSTLANLLGGNPLPFARIRQIVEQIGDALNYAHMRGIVHSDIKPSNILIDEGGSWLLTDFGLARMLKHLSDKKIGGIIGTPYYMSPEQGTGLEVDGRSDIYSFGVILYEMATGRVPYYAETPIAIVFKHIHDPLPRARSINPDLPETIERVILKALAKRPEDRYQTAKELVMAVQAAIPSGHQESVHQPKGTSRFFTKSDQKENRISILFLAADPSDASRLRLGEELREIQEKLQLAKLREQFELHQRMSVRPADISQALLDVQPKVVHFSGHGTAKGALCFENQMGETHPIQPGALAALFEQFANQVNCVILNACYSEIQAKAIAQHIDYVIGMNQTVGDKAAIAFAVGFYQALGAGRTMEQAYKLGCVQIRLQAIPEHLTPVLIKKAEAQL